MGKEWKMSAGLPFNKSDSKRRGESGWELEELGDPRALIKCVGIGYLSPEVTAREGGSTLLRGHWREY